jgi:hypothetical protein
MVFQAEDRTKAKKQQADAAIQMALQGRWQDAAELNRSILESFPGDVDAYNRLGKAMTELGKYEDARQAYMRAIEIDPINSIAQKNLSRLATLGKKAPPKPANQKLSPQMFIEETGKTGITTLANADMNVANRLTAGDQVQLAADKKGNLAVKTMTGEDIGDVETRLAQRLVKLMEGGNEYVAAISSLGDDSVKVFIRETFQDASQTGKLSFPPTVTETFRPYTKSRLVRDRDDEATYDDSDEIDEWAGAEVEDEEEDSEEPAFEIGRRGKMPSVDLDDEIEE